LISHFTSDYIYNTELILKYCIQITLAQRGFIIIVDTENHVERIIKFDKKHKLPDISHLLERINLKQEGILIKTRFDTRDYQRLDYLPNNAQAAICIPISARKGDVYGFKTERRKNTVENFEKSIIGYIYLDTDKIFNNFDLKTFNVCNVLTNLLYLVIDGYESKISSSIDKVTKVFMRKYFERALKEEMSFSRMNGTYFSVVMCDIDKFKAVNDLFGHRKGDEILSRIGEILKENLRQEDIVGRYGGEEFIILLPNTNESESKFVCEKIRKKVENAELLGSKHTVTISFGIASFPEHGYREEELIEKADQALYYAKEKGRNKTVIWTSHISSIQNRTNQLTGIVSCNMLEDYHRIQVMLEITQLLKDNFNINDKLFTLLGRLIEITEARQGTIVTIKENGIDCYYSRERFKQDWIDDVILNHNKIDEIIETKTGVFMIDWELFPSIDSFTGTPDWQSVMLIPLVNKGLLKGILYLSVPIREQEFDFNTFNFMNVLGNIIGAIL
ncbi:MAG: GGDEF domain-containing protein, partial [Thermotaleaceae bacterium]